MLLIITFTAFMVLGIALIVHYVMHDGYCDEEFMAGACLAVIFGAALIICQRQ